MSGSASVSLSQRRRLTLVQLLVLLVVAFNTVDCTRHDDHLSLRSNTSSGAGSAWKHLPEECDSFADPLRNMVYAGRWDQILIIVLVTQVSAILFSVLFFTLGRKAKPRRPRYWSFHFLSPFRDDFYEEVDVTKALIEPVQRLLDLTTDQNAMGKGMDGHWVTHKRLRVTRITRIENGPQWSKYVLVRNTMQYVQTSMRNMSEEWRTRTARALRTVRLATSVYQEDPLVRRFVNTLSLDESRNEVLLFHGSPGAGARGADGQVLFWEDRLSPNFAIRHGGFDDRLGNVKGMYGAGTYFADKASKADQYAGRYNRPGSPQGSIGEQAMMFLSRVTLGCPFETNFSMEQLRRPPCTHGHFDLNLYWNEDVKIGKPWWEKDVAFRVCDHPRFDSVLADFEIDGKRRLFREYVVYEQQAYPEFCVHYVREPY